jgi:alkylation response protein AidB-like acyl-CoA dehydrogenase
LQNLGIKEGIVAIAYNSPELGHHARLYQFLKYHIWSGSNAIVTCPSAMADGAARLLCRHLAEDKMKEADPRMRVFREAYRNLTSRDPERAWTAGQWMTERSGGSDVRGTETVATYDSTLENDGATDAEGLPLGPWRVNGFKWFSSATDSQMAVLLAQTDKGLSTFFAPMRRAIPKPRYLDVNGSAPAARECEFNGVSIQRLKPKLGTRALPTAELVLKDMRAWPLGQLGRGVSEISTVLNITRIHTAISALAMWGRGLAISRAYARVRRVEGGTLLNAVPAHVKTLAGNALEYWGNMQLGYFVVALLGICEHPHAFESTLYRDHTNLIDPPSSWRPPLIPDLSTAAALLRLLTPVAKGICSKRAIAGLQECTESLGGIGYLEDEEEFNVARLLRDVAVLSIWEGTTDVMGADVVRVMKGRDGEAVRKALNSWIQGRFRSWGATWKEQEETIRAELGRLEEFWTEARGGAEELRWRGRSILEMLAWIVSAVLLVEDAERDGDDVAREVAKRWIALKAGSEETQDWKEVAQWDRKIAFASDEQVAQQKTSVAKL